MGRPALVMTPAVVERAYALSKTHNVRAAARVLGVGHDTLKMWAQRRGVQFVKGKPGRPALPRPVLSADRPRRKPGKAPSVMTGDRVAEALRLAAEGAALLHASQRMGVNVTTLGRWARRQGVTFADGRVRA